MNILNHFTKSLISFLDIFFKIENVNTVRLFLTFCESFPTNYCVSLEIFKHEEYIDFT